jgi:hypothetical protein
MEGIFERIEEGAEAAVIFEGMAKRQVSFDLVMVAAADTDGCDISFAAQIGEDALGGALSDADVGGDVLQADIRVARDAEEYVGMVGEEGPLLHSASMAQTCDPEFR